MERSNGTWRQEFYRVTRVSPDSIAPHRRQLRDWERTYNTIRPHQALGYQTPAEFLLQWKREHPEAPINLLEGVLHHLNEYTMLSGAGDNGMLFAMATLPVTVSPPARARRRRVLRIEVDADRFERLAADFGLFNPDFLESVERAEADARAGRVREVASLRELRRPRRR